MRRNTEKHLTQRRKDAKTLAPWRLGVILCALFCSCATSPRVIEVTSRTRLQDIDKADEKIFVRDFASRIPYEPQDLPADQQREEFYVHWRGANVDRVKFEYRQVDRPNTIEEKTLTPVNRHWYVFDVRGEDFHTGGLVSAWRVSLWSGDQLLAERKSALW